MAETTIRAYKPADRNEVIRLWGEVFPNPAEHNNPESTIEQFLSAGTGVFLVACQGNRVVGTALGGFDGHRGWLYSLAVANEQRRKRIGSRLVTEVERRLTTFGCKKINLQIRSENNTVVDFYEHLGYEIEDRISMGRLVEQTV